MELRRLPFTLPFVSLVVPVPAAPYFGFVVGAANTYHGGIDMLTVANDSNVLTLPAASIVCYLLSGLCSSCRLSVVGEVVESR